MNFEWELIYESKDKCTRTERSKVPGGWLVKDLFCVFTDDATTRRYSTAQTTNFISDSYHEWDIEG